MKQPGIQVNPIGQITGQFEFNEVVFHRLSFVPEDHVLGEVDGAWKQATSELAYERSGPERFLETYYVLTELVRAVGKKSGYPQRRGHRPPGGAVAHDATHVGVGGRHAAGRQGAGGGSPPSSRTSARCGSRRCPHRVRDPLRRSSRKPPPNRETLEKPAFVRDQDRAETDDPGRHHRSAARQSSPADLGLR